MKLIQMYQHKTTPTLYCSRAIYKKSVIQNFTGTINVLSCNDSKFDRETRWQNKDFTVIVGSDNVT